MIRDSLQQIVASAVARLVDSGQLPSAVRDVRVEISETKQPEHGDYACNFAMVASKPAGVNPRQLAETLAAAISDEAIQFAEVAGPGFLNFRLNPAWLASFVPHALRLGEKVGHISQSEVINPQSINVEFVSVNPNGPITIGSGRGAAYGSALCNVLEAAGNRVHREYYINDGVNSEQMRLFAKSVQDYCFNAEYADITDPDQQYLIQTNLEVVDEFNELLGPDQGGQSEEFFRNRYREWLKNLPQAFESRRTTVIRNHLERTEPDFNGSPIARTVKARYQVEYLDGSFRPYIEVYGESGYKGEAYIRAARHILKNFGHTDLIDDKFGNDGIPWFKEQSEEYMLQLQREDLGSFGTTFDTWFSEQSLHDSGAVAAEMEKMLASGVADDREFRTKLKLAKGGKIEDVEVEDQAGKADVEEDEHGEGQTPSHAVAESPSHQKTLWLRSTKFGDDMDRVLRRRDGRLTYIASDVAYHKDKLTDESGTRGTGPVDRMITILGPDHHGYIGRLQAVVAAMLKADGLVEVSAGGEPDTFTEIDAKLYDSARDRDACRAALSEAKNKLEVQIYQLVRFMKDGKPAPMRKRDGNIYALIDLLKEIGENVKPTGTEDEKLTAGKDVARFFYLMRSHDTTFDFDLDLAEKQSDENPVFYVQYAHARICSVISKASEQGLSADPTSLDSTLLSHERELALIKKICDLPFEVRRCAEDYGVHRLTTYAIELARTYHHFYDVCRVIQVDQLELSRARLALCEATRNALKATLDLLGVSAPERMDRTSE